MINVLTTGGTIGGLEYVNVEDKSSQKGIDISKFLMDANISEEYSIDHLFDKDSRHITLDDRKLILEKIKSSTSNNILVTHGTYTMCETAKYLGALSLDKVIILTGSFILGTQNNTDAPFNLGFAIAAIQYLDKGVYIAMNGQIFHWNNVVKNIEDNRFEKENE